MGKKDLRLKTSLFHSLFAAAATVQVQVKLSSCVKIALLLVFSKEPCIRHHLLVSSSASSEHYSRKCRFKFSVPPGAQPWAVAEETSPSRLDVPLATDTGCVMSRVVSVSFKGRWVLSASVCVDCCISLARSLERLQNRKSQELLRTDTHGAELNTGCTLDLNRCCSSQPAVHTNHYHMPCLNFCVWYRKPNIFKAVSHCLFRASSCLLQRHSSCGLSSRVRLLLQKTEDYRCFPT